MTDYFLNADWGSDSNAGTSPDVPWLSIDKLNNTTFSAGDTINFHCDQEFEGDFFLNNSGTNGNEIIVQSYGVVRGSKAATIKNESGNDGERCIQIGGDYITVRDLHITGAHRAGIEIFQNHTGVTIQNCHIENVGSGVINKGSGNVVEYCFIHANKMAVDDNVNTDFGGIGIINEGIASGSADNNEYRNNILYRCVAPSRYFTEDGGGLECFGSGDGNKFYNNYLIGCKGWIEIGGRNFGTETFENFECYNNIGEDNQGRFIYINDPGGSAPVNISNLHFYNNTYYDPVNPVTAIYIDGAVTDWTGLATKVIIEGNIFEFGSADLYSFDVSDASEPTHENNLYYSAAGGAVGLTLDGSEYNSNPNFEDATKSKFRPTSGNALNNGKSISGYAGAGTDAVGTDVPASNVDMGALQTLVVSEKSGNYFRVNNQITRHNENASFALADSSEIKGSHKWVRTAQELHDIPTALLAPGMTVYVDAMGGNAILKGWEGERQFWLLPTERMVQQRAWFGHTEAQGTGGGSDGATADTYDQRPITDEWFNNIPNCVIDTTNNDFTVNPGVYEIDAEFTMGSVNEMQGALYNETAADYEDACYGLNGWGSTSTELNSNLRVRGMFTALVRSTYRLECFRENEDSTANHTRGRELNKSGVGREQYMKVKLTKISEVLPL